MTSRLLQALGATPVSMPPAQMTESLSKGVIDGALVGWEVIPALKLDEVTRFHAEPEAGQPIFSTTLLSFLMNRKRYESLPDDLRAIVDRNSGLGLSVTFGASWDKEGNRARQVVADQGAMLVRIDSQAYRSMREVGDQVTVAWSAEAEGNGIKGSELARTLREIAVANGLKY
ncbi:Bacterial extracellular solute-binding protein, family 7 [compost metagenome]